LSEKLGSDLPDERLWALGKISSYSGQITGQLLTALLDNIADPDDDIRLATANVLAGKSALNPGARLLAQLKVEKVPEVALAIFDALGEACFFAFSPGSPIKLPDEVRIETLALAGQYLSSQDATVSEHGAEVLRKLLELNGLEPEDSLKYLQLLSVRYGQAQEVKTLLRGKLLSVMARLCGRSSYKSMAVELFEPAFIAGLDEAEDAIVRQAASTGLANIDQAKAFKLFKEKGLANDPSSAVRRVVINVTGQLGDESEIAWLIEKTNANGEAELAWQAARSILARQTAAVVFSWVGRLPESSVNSPRAVQLLAMVETKAVSEKDLKILAQARNEMLKRNLATGDIPKAVGLFAKHLLESKDVDPGDTLVVRLQAWLASESTEATQRVAMISALAKIEKPETADWPKWASIIKGWQDKYIPKPTPTPAEPVQTKPEA